MKKTTIKSRKEKNKSGKFNCDICGNKDILVCHHINGRDIQNANHPSNLSNICPNCHAKVHYGHIIIEKWVMSTNGLILLWHKKNETGITGEDSKPPLLI